MFSLRLLYVISFAILSTKLFASFEPEKIYKKCAMGVVLIETPYSFGSGFIVTGDSWVVTNSHVIENTILNDIKIQLKNGNQARVSEAMYSKKLNDIGLVLLKIEPQLSDFILPICVEDPVIGKDILVIGHPNGLNWTQTRGIITNSEQFNYDFQYDIAMNVGNSGSPVLDKYGRVQGIVRSVGSEDSFQNHCISNKYLIEILKELSVDYSTNSLVNADVGLVDNQLRYIEEERGFLKRDKEALIIDRELLEKRKHEFEEYKISKEQEITNRYKLLHDEEAKFVIAKEREKNRLRKEDSAVTYNRDQMLNNRAAELYKQQSDLELEREKNLVIIERAKAATDEIVQKRIEISKLNSELIEKKQEIQEFENELDQKLNYIATRESELAIISPDHFGIELNLGMDWFYDRSREGKALGSMISQFGLFYRFGFTDNNQTSDRLGVVMSPMREIFFEDLMFIGDWYYDISVAAEFSNAVRISVGTNLVEGNLFGSEDKYYSAMVSVSMNDYPWPIRFYTRFESHAYSDRDKIALGISIGYGLTFGKW